MIEINRAREVCYPDAIITEVWLDQPVPEVTFHKRCIEEQEDRALAEAFAPEVLPAASLVDWRSFGMGMNAGAVVAGLIVLLCRLFS